MTGALLSASIHSPLAPQTILETSSIILSPLWLQSSWEIHYLTAVNKKQQDTSASGRALGDQWWKTNLNKLKRKQEVNLTPTSALCLQGNGPAISGTLAPGLNSDGAQTLCSAFSLCWLNFLSSKWLPSQVQRGSCLSLPYMMEELSSYTWTTYLVGGRGFPDQLRSSVSLISSWTRPGGPGRLPLGEPRPGCDSIQRNRLLCRQSQRSRMFKDKKWDHTKWNLTICDNMVGPRGHYAKWSKSEKDKYSTISFICGI